LSLFLVDLPSEVLPFTALSGADSLTLEGVFGFGVFFESARGAGAGGSFPAFCGADSLTEAGPLDGAVGVPEAPLLSFPALSGADSLTDAGPFTSAA
jgi:hypothetical protein